MELSHGPCLPIASAGGPLSPCTRARSCSTRFLTWAHRRRRAGRGGMTSWPSWRSSTAAMQPLRRQRQPAASRPCASLPGAGAQPEEARRLACQGPLEGLLRRLTHSPSTRACRNAIVHSRYEHAALCVAWIGYTRSRFDRNHSGSDKYTTVRRSKGLARALRSMGPKV